MYLICLVLLFPVPDEAFTLGIGQPWYDQDKTMAQSIEGILDYEKTTGRIGTPTGYLPFRLIRKDPASGKVIQHLLYAPGAETVLALNVGQRVQLEAKLISKGEGDAKREELWVGKLQALGTAPLSVFTEIKPIARTNRFQPSAVPGNRGEIATKLMKSGKEVAIASGITNRDDPDAEMKGTQYLCSLFGIKTIDWKTQMVIYVGNAYQRNFQMTKIEITKMEVHEKGMTVFWKSEPTQKVVAASPYSTDTILVPRIDGEITFKQDESAKKEGETKEVPEKIRPVVPTAPIK